MSDLPTEIWAMVFAYSEDPKHLWISCRHVSSNLKAAVEIYTSTIFLPNLVTVSLSYRTKDKSTIRCQRGTFKGYSPDKKVIYFDMSRDDRPYIEHDDTQRMSLAVDRLQTETVKKEFKVMAKLKGPDHDRAFFVKLLDGVNASPADSSEGTLTFGLDLEDKILSFDWREVMTKSFMDSTGSEGYLVDYVTWRGGRDRRFPWWF